MTNFFSVKKRDSTLLRNLLAILQNTALDILTISFENNN
jgi:hypothetical protein